MRVAIIIIGILGLLTLALNWDNLSPNTEIVPKEGYIDKNDNPKTKKCTKKCVKENEIVEEKKRGCKKHMTLTASF